MGERTLHASEKCGRCGWGVMDHLRGGPCDDHRWESPAPTSPAPESPMEGERGLVRYYPGGDPERAGCCPSCHTQLSEGSIHLLAASRAASPKDEGLRDALDSCAARVSEIADRVMNGGDASYVAHDLRMVAISIRALASGDALTERE